MPTLAVKMSEIVQRYCFVQLMQIWQDSLHNDRPNQHISHGFFLMVLNCRYCDGLRALSCSSDSRMLCSFWSCCVLSGLNNEGQTLLFQCIRPIVICCFSVFCYKEVFTHALLTVAPKHAPFDINDSSSHMSCWWEVCCIIMHQILFIVFINIFSFYFYLV